MLRRMLSCGLVCGAVAACTPTMTPQERSVEEQIVRDRTTAWIRSFNNQNRDSLANYYLQTPELTVAWPTGLSNGWEEERGMQEEYFRAVSSLNMVAQDVRVAVLAPNVAVVTFRHSTDEIRGTDRPQRDLFSGGATMVWIRPDPRSSWVIRNAQLSRNAAAAAPARR
jgi:hypothetical protein